jgi:hypothetical protein
MTGARKFSGAAVCGAVAVIAALAAVPFLAARVISESRIRTAAEQTSTLAEHLRRGLPVPAGAEVLIGVGNLPESAGGSEWRTRPSAPLAQIVSPAAPPEATQDPWRNAYLVNVGAARMVRVLSAGPNGLVETPFESAYTAGDDIASPVTR